MVSCFLWCGDLRSTLHSLVDVWRIRHRPDVLLLFYEDIIDAHAATVRRLAEFMGIEADEQLIARVIQQTSHASMTADHAVFANRAQAKNMYAAQGLMLDESALVGKVRRGGGKVGAAREELGPSFSLAFARGWKTHVHSQLGYDNYVV